jgi:hypothetical protein
MTIQVTLASIAKLLDSEIITRVEEITGTITRAEEEITGTITRAEEEITGIIISLKKDIKPGIRF